MAASRTLTFCVAQGTKSRSPATAGAPIAWPTLRSQAMEPPRATTIFERAPTPPPVVSARTERFPSPSAPARWRASSGTVKATAPVWRSRATTPLDSWSTARGPATCGAETGLETGSDQRSAPEVRSTAKSRSVPIPRATGGAERAGAARRRWSTAAMSASRLSGKVGPKALPPPPPQEARARRRAGARRARAMVIGRSGGRPAPPRRPGVRGGELRRGPRGRCGPPGSRARRGARRPRASRSWPCRRGRAPRRGRA